MTMKGAATFRIPPPTPRTVNRQPTGSASLSQLAVSGQTV